ncbi:MAG: 2-isopropylmalate synthase [Deltaproteobacteria bacterium]|nr:2-isopropylmalate synthase [Deltaproteobacteria bacterium]
MSDEGRTSPGDFIFDWNQIGKEQTRPIGQVTLLDETLRDGLQSPSVTDPAVADKVKILRWMDLLHIEHADLGLPGAGPRAVQAVTALCHAIREDKLKIRAACAARTLDADVEPVIRISQETGVPIEILTFLGASPIRTWAEGWTLDKMRELVERAVRLGVRAGLDVAFVTEDTVRAHPAVLTELFKTAIGEGAKRLVICDTVGHATPEGVYAVFEWTQELLARLDVKVGLDFHGHNDRGLGLVNSLVALKAGADRVHATALGIGERVGNCSMDQLLVNLSLFGVIDRDLTPLQAYCHAVSQATGRPIPDNYPVIGADAFRTATGIHASAIVKAWTKAGDLLANHVYSGVPSHLVGRTQVIAIGPFSGDSNIMAWLARNDIAPNPTVVAEIRRAAKASDHTLSDEELHVVVERCLEE